MIRVKVIAPEDMRQKGALGDWIFLAGDLHVYVREMEDPRHETLIAVHEIIEAVLCEERGVPECRVMLFDLENPNLDDPGSDPRAPYHPEHEFATDIEKLLAVQLGVDWDTYSEACAKVAQ